MKQQKSVIIFAFIAAIIIAFAWARTRPATPSVSPMAPIGAGLPVSGSTDRTTTASQNPNTPVTSSLINLQDLPAGETDPNNQYDRFMRGEITFAGENGVLDPLTVQDLKLAALALETSDRIIQVSQSPTSTGTSFPSLDYTESGGGFVPPDPELAVGPNHILAVVNVAFEIYDKSGSSLIGPMTFKTLFSGITACSNLLFDPNALYDKSADRFFMAIDSMDAAGNSYYCTAVSKTNDPTGEWYRYIYALGSGFVDYPHAGIGNDAIYMGANVFTCTDYLPLPSGCTFSESRVWAFDKQKMYAGLVTTRVSKTLPQPYHFTPIPLHIYDPGNYFGPHYFVTKYGGGAEYYYLLSWDSPYSSNILTELTWFDLNFATFTAAGYPLPVPQKDGQMLQGNDYTVQDFEYYGGTGWINMTVSCNPGDGTSVNCVRVAQVDLINELISEAFVFSSNGEHRVFSDLAVDDCGNLAIGYTKSSTAMYPGIWYTGKLAGEYGTLQPESQLKAGELPYTAFDTVPHRWGDYTGMTTDPDGKTFWYLGEYSKNTGTTNGRWGTYIGAFTFGCDPIGPPPTPEYNQFLPIILTTQGNP